MDISQQDRERISLAVRQVEDKTSGEIVCVVARTSTQTTALPVIMATLLSLSLPWLLVAFTAMTVYRILSLQALCFLILLFVFSLPRVRLAFLPNRTRRLMAWRNATEQFVTRGISSKQNRCGVLIFVSLAEHYARIIADEGIASKVPQSTWQGAVDALIAHAKQDRIADGLIAAVELCGAELATHFPRTGAKSEELPDRIYLISNPLATRKTARHAFRY